MADNPRMLLRPTALALLHRLQHGLSNPPAELVHIPHARWPLPAHQAPHIERYPKSRPLKISVLDASFNPPTLAHLALANTPYPNNKNIDPEGDYEDEEADAEVKRLDYDAKLLLLSVRNADKPLKPEDATYLQRLEMMSLLAQGVSPSQSQGSANLAIAIIDEPTFVGKSSCLLQFLKKHLEAAAPAVAVNVHFQLSFILGLDTLERLVAPRYYPSEAAMLSSLQRFLSPSADDSIVVCAHRKSSDSVQSDVGNKLAMAEELIHSNRIFMIDIGDEESKYSSTSIRTTIKHFGLGEDSQNQWRKFVSGSIADYIIREKLYVDL